MTRVTHKQAIGRCIRYMENNGMKRTRGSFALHRYPDLAFYSDQYQFLILLEVKPSYCMNDEIAKGIGQCVSYMARKDVKPYLVISEYYWNRYQSDLTLPEMSWLGVIVYDDYDKMWTAKKSERQVVKSNFGVVTENLQRGQALKGTVGPQPGATSQWR